MMVGRWIDEKWNAARSTGNAFMSDEQDKPGSDLRVGEPVARGGFLLDEARAREQMQ